MIDITAPKHEVEISIADDNTTPGTLVIWVNVDGKCELRACRVPANILTVEDRRSTWKPNP